MKLVIAIVQDDDALDLIDAITEAGFRVTKLATTGGFLKSGNTTLMIGVEVEKVQKVIDVVEDICKTRKQIITTPTPITGNLDMYMSYPIEVEVGGATIFVIDVDQFIKI
ncbi:MULTISPECIES: cyclic-di-AMP receptor [unclassified Clostridium]|uniref:cyclic-di-AMP receptor n=1 Tax=unclassified Clostridium TaxID=2614128 RepID=UPI00290BA02C|nr:cyclic-di-AMP receptor [Clostridium sp.]MDU5106442.1 cyclic-di-AMP receptor [Clostridium sp.]